MSLVNIVLLERDARFPDVVAYGAKSMICDYTPLSVDATPPTPDIGQKSECEKVQSVSGRKYLKHENIRSEYDNIKSATEN